MNNNNRHLEDIKTIKRIMEDSTKFLSISGLAGIFMGCFAIAGVIVARIFISDNILIIDRFMTSFLYNKEASRILRLLYSDALVVLILSIVAALFFSILKARKNKHKIWSPISRRLLLNLAIPLLTGGFFIMITLGKIPMYVSVSITLIFYGLALVNASKFTLGEIYWFGMIEIILGLFCLIFPGYTVLFWVSGFGLLHIIYGLYMHFKYK